MSTIEVICFDSISNWWIRTLILIEKVDTHLPWLLVDWVGYQSKRPNASNQYIFGCLWFDGNLPRFCVHLIDCDSIWGFKYIYNTQPVCAAPNQITQTNFRAKLLMKCVCVRRCLRFFPFFYYFTLNVLFYKNCPLVGLFFIKNNFPCWCKPPVCLRNFLVYFELRANIIKYRHSRLLFVP